MDYKELAKLLGVYVDRKSDTYENTFRKYMDMGEGINNSNQSAYRECIIEDIRNLRGQIKDLQDQVSKLNKEKNNEI